MEYIVLDLEWNQGEGKREERGKSLPFEIIEIGAVKLNEKREVSHTFHRVIRPVVYPQLFEITKQLIELTDQDLQQGGTFQEAGREFLDWCGSNPYRFCTWGPSDLTVLQQNLAFFEVSFEMEYPLYYYDVQQLYSVVFEEGQNARNLEYAVRELNLPIERPFHGALADAEYAAEVFERISPELVSSYPALDLYHHPGPEEDAIFVQCPDYRQTVSRSYETREEVRMDRRMAQLCCCICGKKGKRLIPWFCNSNSNRNYDSLGICREHGYLKGRLVIKNPASQEFFGIQTVRLASEEEESRLEARYQEKKRQDR